MKLDLVLENVKNTYNLGLLEESDSLSEKEVLKGKILINESISMIRKMLIEEGTMAQVQETIHEAYAYAIMDEMAYIQESETAEILAELAAGATVAALAAKYGPRAVSSAKASVKNSTSSTMGKAKGAVVAGSKAVKRQVKADAGTVMGKVKGAVKA